MVELYWLYEANDFFTSNSFNFFFNLTSKEIFAKANAVGNCFCTDVFYLFKSPTKTILICKLNTKARSCVELDDKWTTLTVNKEVNPTKAKSGGFCGLNCIR
jgi:hypothetical protein